MNKTIITLLMSVLPIIIYAVLLVGIYIYLGTWRNPLSCIGWIIFGWYCHKWVMRTRNFLKEIDGEE